MKKLILFLITVLPLLLFAQNEKAQLDKDLKNYISATNNLNCQALIYYAPKMVFVGQTEAEFLFECEHNRLDRMDFMKKTLMPRYIIDTLVISDGSKYAKVRIPAEVEVSFAEAEVIEEYSDDSFYYGLMEAYCADLEDRPDVRAVFVDQEYHKVYYTCLDSVLALWEDGHWTFLPQQDSETLPPLDVLEPDLLYQ